MQVWNVLHAARWKHRALSHNFVGLYLRI